MTSNNGPLAEEAGDLSQGIDSAGQKSAASNMMSRPRGSLERVSQIEHTSSTEERSSVVLETQEHRADDDAVEQG